MSSRFFKLLILFLIVFAFFLVSAKLDYYVNDTLYRYGLRFSYEWATGYWTIYTLEFLVFAIMAGFVYWFASQKTRCDLKITTAIVTTIVLLAVGGLQDILFFGIWGGKGFPSDNVDWWWSWLHGIFGFWNTSMQISLVTVVFGVCGVVWWLALRNPKKVCAYPF